MKNYSEKSSFVDTKNNKTKKTEAYIIIGGYRWRVNSIRQFNEVTEQRIKRNSAAAKEEAAAKKTKEDVPSEAFKEGSLLRGIIERKIFVIEKGFRKYIYPGALYRYSGQRVWTVRDDELARIPLFIEDKSFESYY